MAKRKEQDLCYFEPTARRDPSLSGPCASLDYREYQGDWTLWFEEHWLKPRLRGLGYEHVRFFGGRTCEYDGSYRERVCELRRPGMRVEYYVYG